MRRARVTRHERYRADWDPRLEQSLSAYDGTDSIRVEMESKVCKGHLRRALFSSVTPIADDAAVLVAYIRVPQYARVEHDVVDLEVGNGGELCDKGLGPPSALQMGVMINVSRCCIVGD